MNARQKFTLFYPFFYLSHFCLLFLRQQESVSLELLLSIQLVHRLSFPSLETDAGKKWRASLFWRRSIDDAFPLWSLCPGGQENDMVKTRTKGDRSAEGVNFLFNFHEKFIVFYFHFNVTAREKDETTEEQRRPCCALQWTEFTLSFRKLSDDCSGLSHVTSF